MMTLDPSHTQPAIHLEQLLLREDIWLGHSRRFRRGETVDTGYESLNSELAQEGWPRGALIEVCQRSLLAEWQLFAPALKQVDGLIVLLNPPAIPFCQGLVQAGIDLDAVMIVDAGDKANFIACFTELVRAGVGAVLAWQPNEAFTYTELRKCQLASTEDHSLCVVFRSASMQQQNSPAVLRIYAQLIPDGIEITIFKQKGQLLAKLPRPITVQLPERWKPLPTYRELDRVHSSDKPGIELLTINNVLQLRGKP